MHQISRAVQQAEPECNGYRLSSIACIELGSKRLLKHVRALGGVVAAE